MKSYLEQQKIDYEIYHKKEEGFPNDQELGQAYREAYSKPQRMIQFKK